MREAQGNRTAAEFAVQICAEFCNPKGAPAPVPPIGDFVPPPQMQTAAPLDKAKNESVNQSPHVEASHENPYFAHLAMCTEGMPPPVQTRHPFRGVSATRHASSAQNGLNDKFFQRYKAFKSF